MEKRAICSHCNTVQVLDYKKSKEISQLTDGTVSLNRFWFRCQKCKCQFLILNKVM